MTTITIPEYIYNPRHSISVALIGAGGTGSELLTKLGRIAYTMNMVDGRDLMVHLIDPDRVDTPNLGRQLFCTGDLGRYKSDVLIERVNRFYGTDWASYPKKVERTDLASMNIIITCTDNVESRQQVKKYIDYSKKTASEYMTYFWLDMGNDFNSGNIILSNKTMDLPDPFDIFEKIENNPSRPSCSLAEAIQKQHLMVNPFIADLASMMLWDILMNKEIDYQGMFFSMESMKIVKIPVGHYKIKNQPVKKVKMLN